jgi:hypothetical protein
MKTSHSISSVVLALLLPAFSACAQSATFNFDSAQWVEGSVSPYLNMAPDTAQGFTNLRASFTSSPDQDAFGIHEFGINPSFSWLALLEYGSYFDTLTVSLSEPVNSVSLDFVLSLPGHLDFLSEAGTTSVLSDDYGVGSLSFRSPTSFSEFSLVGKYEDWTVQFAMDNLVVAVPEPCTFALAGVGTIALMVVRRRAVGAAE